MKGSFLKNGISNPCLSITQMTQIYFNACNIRVTFKQGDQIGRISARWAVV
jgi:hypothetical protein